MAADDDGDTNARDTTTERDGSSGGSLHDLFDRMAERASRAAGNAWAFGIAVTILVVWALTGPLLKFSNTWQLIINTGTTIVTFLMVFLIQHSSNKDSEAIQIKLDELIAATTTASNRLIAIEDLDDRELDAIRKRFARLAQEADRLDQHHPKGP
jgi:low affinity Fe/Cu permease